MLGTLVVAVLLADGRGPAGHRTAKRTQVRSGARNRYRCWTHLRWRHGPQFRTRRSLRVCYGRGNRRGDRHVHSMKFDPSQAKYDCDGNAFSISSLVVVEAGQLDVAAIARSLGAC